MLSQHFYDFRRHILWASTFPSPSLLLNRLLLQIGTKLLGEPEIRNFELIFRENEQVLKLDVIMSDTMGVQIFKTRGDLANEAFEVANLWERRPV